jgi:serine protease Do
MKQKRKTKPSINSQSTSTRQTRKGNSMSHSSLRFALLAVGAATAIQLAVISTSCAVEPTHVAALPNAPHASSLSKEIRSAADRVSPGLVTVYSLRGPRMTVPWRMREEMRNHREWNHSGFQPSAQPTVSSPDDQGSGIVIDSKGFVLTCHHVVADADAVFVRTADGRKFHTDHVWSDPETDLALIRLDDADELKAVQLGNSDDLEIGEWVVSVACPYDLEQSISSGIISATQRWIPGTPHPLIQNAAATNPGSSGGALVNLRGEVVGIIIGGYSTKGDFQGIGLAVPINIAKQIAQQLRTAGKAQHGYFGFSTQMLSPDMAKTLGLPIQAGLYMKEIHDNSPASRAGLQEGDVVTQFDNTAIDDEFDPRLFYQDPVPGKEHTLTLYRNGQTIQVPIEMGQPPVWDATSSEQTKTRPVVSFKYLDQELGLGLSTLTPMETHELDLPEATQGALITHVAKGSIAYLEGLAAGMAVVRINEHAIRNLDDYERIRERSNSEKPVLMLVQANQSKYLVMIENNQREDDE